LRKGIIQLNPDNKTLRKAILYFLAVIGVSSAIRLTFISLRKSWPYLINGEVN